MDQRTEPSEELQYGSSKIRMPAVDVYDEKDDVTMKAEIPGLSKEDISVEVTDTRLTIKRGEETGRRVEG